MLNAYGQVSGDDVLGERISRGSQSVVAGMTTDLVFTTPETFRQDCPEFTDCPDDTTDLLIFFLHTNTLNLYELNASEPAPVTPSPTPYASPEPLCNVGDDIGNWVGAGLLDESWAESTPEGLDAAASLRGQLSNGGDVSFGTPSTGQTVEYRYMTYRYLDYLSLPVGCAPSFPEQSFRSAALSVLIPVSQETVVQVTYVEMNASLAAGASPTATFTPAPNPSATATATAPVPATMSPTAIPAGPTATSNPNAVTGLPNTGVQPSESERGDLLFAVLALMLALAVTTAIWTCRRPR